MSPLVYRRLTDEQLGGRLARGEAPAFDELYRRYVHRLAAYGAHLLGDGAAGDDVAQSALLKAYGAFRAGRVPEQVRPWLYRIAHNAAIDLVRRRQEIPAEVLPEAAAPSGTEAGALVAALAALPDRQRRVYVLRELHGLRIDETAAELGLSPQQVEQSLFAARNRLAEHLVFGDRLNCAAVRRLAAGPLELAERRALKSHLRSCPDCRSELGLRGRALGSLPLAPSEWLQWLGGLFAGGGAPVAAKIGVVAAAATVAAGVPLAADRPAHFFHAAPAAHAAVVHRPAAKPTKTRLPSVTTTAAVAVRRPVAARPVPLELKQAVPRRDHIAETHRSHVVEDAGHVQRDRVERRDGGGEDGGRPPAATTTTTIPVISIDPTATPTATTTTPTFVPSAPPTTTITTTTTTDSGSSGDGSSSSDGGGDGGGGGDSSGSGD